MIAQGFQRRQGARRDHVGGALPAFPKILHTLSVDLCREVEKTDRLAQEGGLFAIAFNEMNLRAGRFGKGAGDRDGRKAAARAEVDPDFGAGDNVQKLQRVGDVPGPDFRDRRRRDQIYPRLPFQEQRDEPVQAFSCFT